MASNYICGYDYELHATTARKNRKCIMCTEANYVKLVYEEFSLC